MRTHRSLPADEWLSEQREQPRTNPEPYDPGETLWTAPRGEGQRVRLARKTFKGRTYLDLRVEYEPQPGTWAPTRKGLSLRSGELGALAAALEGAAEVGS